MRVNPEGLRALRQLALDQDTTLQALMVEAANDLLRKYRRRAEVEIDCCQAEALRLAQEEGVLARFACAQPGEGQKRPS